MAAADAALYEAKRGGRDRVGVAAARVVDGVAMFEAEKSAAGWD